MPLEDGSGLQGAIVAPTGTFALGRFFREWGSEEHVSYRQYARWLERTPHPPHGVLEGAYGERRPDARDRVVALRTRDEVLGVSFHEGHGVADRLRRSPRTCLGDEGGLIRG